jgi:thiopeptide-type bacteriocin biosynthesis protein
VFAWAQNLIKSDLCTRFAVDTYEREIDRYGGAHAIEIAEQLFCLDSESALGMLRLLGPRYPLRRVELALAGIDFLFQKMGYSSFDRLALFNGVAQFRHEASAVYRERKTVLQALIGGHDDPSLAEAIKSTFGVLEKNAPSISDLWCRLQQVNAEGRLTLSLDAVFKSFAHMHCNRMGLDMTDERLAYGLLVRSYDSLHAFSRQKAGRAAVKVSEASRL